MVQQHHQPKIGIVGYGYVGKAMFNFFQKKYTTVFFDPFVEGSCTKDEINTCDMALVCVFTPQAPDGSCDTSIVEATIEWLQTPLILIKSTIAPGTTDRLKATYHKRIMFSPEYIGESTYNTGRHNFNKDAANMEFITIGGDAKDVHAAVDLIMPIFGPNKKYQMVDAITAELAKYMENTYFATKLTFCYEFERICAAYGASYHAVRECWLLDPRVESSHTGVFSTNTHPFDGKCLPKDLAAIIRGAEERGYSPELLKEVRSTNDRIGRERNGSLQQS
jgi:UDPglucose 6-dehydrogenase